MAFTIQQESALSNELRNEISKEYAHYASTNETSSKEIFYNKSDSNIVYRFKQIVIFCSDNTLKFYYSQAMDPFFFAEYENDDKINASELKILMDEFNSNQNILKNLEQNTSKKDDEMENDNLKYKDINEKCEVLKYTMEDKLAAIINLNCEKSFQMIIKWIQSFVSINKIIDINKKRLSLLCAQDNELSFSLKRISSELLIQSKTIQKLNKSLEKLTQSISPLTLKNTRLSSELDEYRSSLELLKKLGGTERRAQDSLQSHINDNVTQLETNERELNLLNNQQNERSILLKSNKEILATLEMQNLECNNSLESNKKEALELEAENKRLEYLLKDTISSVCSQEGDINNLLKKRNEKLSPVLQETTQTEASLDHNNSLVNHQ